MPHFSPPCTFPMPRRRAAALPRRGVFSTKLNVSVLGR